MKKLVLLLIALSLLSCSSDKKAVEEVVVEFRFAETTPAEGLTEYTFPQSKEKFYLHQEVVMSNKEIDNAMVDEWQGRSVVRLVLTAGGKEKFAQLTADNINRHMAILVNGKLVTAPRINAPITQGMALINGDFSKEEAKRIVEGINR
mgnify:CR=1 FL=1